MNFFSQYRNLVNMSLQDKATDFWYNLKMSSLIIPYIYKELDRKYNRLSKIRKLEENDPDLPKNLKGKVCIITGGTRGLGAEVVKALLQKDCHVITGSSSLNESDRKKRYDEIRAEVPEAKGKLEIWALNLKSMDSVVEFADKFKEKNIPLNYLITNAGIMMRPIKLTQDGFEEHLAVNYLSHSLLIDRLIDNLYETSKKTESESRIVLVSSVAHKVSYIKFNDFQLKEGGVPPLFAYGQSKLAQIMFTIRMHRWLKDRGEDWSKSITINSLHPGVCDTEILSHLPVMEELKPMAAQAFRVSLFCSLLLLEIHIKLYFSPIFVDFSHFLCFSSLLKQKLISYFNRVFYEFIYLEFQSDLVP